MSYSRGTYVKNLMVAIGNPLTLIAQPNSDAQLTYYWLIGWSVHESQAGQNCPLYNLFGCGHKVAGSINAPCSTHGVQEYQNITSSVLAMSLNLASPLYTYLHAALLRDDVTTLQTSAEIQAELGTWISGSRSYGGYNKQTANFVALGKQHENDQFPDRTGQSSAPPPVPADDPCRVIFDQGSPTDPAIQRLYAGCVACVAALGTANNTKGASVADCVAQFSGTGNATPSVPDPTQAISDFFASLSDWKRDAKVAIGAALILIAATMLIKPLANSGVGQQVTRIASVAA